MKINKTHCWQVNIKKPHLINKDKKTDKHNKCQEQDSWQVSEQNNEPHWIKNEQKQSKIKNFIELNEHEKENRQVTEQNRK